jgi:hypothetical protein
MVGEFFDRALYYLARGYEAAAAWEREHVGTTARRSAPNGEER